MPVYLSVLVHGRAESGSLLYVERSRQIGSVSPFNRRDPCQLADNRPAQPVFAQAVYTIFYLGLRPGRFVGLRHGEDVEDEGRGQQNRYRLRSCPRGHGHGGIRIVELQTSLPDVFQALPYQSGPVLSRARFESVTLIDEQITNIPNRKVSPAPLMP